MPFLAKKKFRLKSSHITSKGYGLSVKESFLLIQIDDLTKKEAETLFTALKGVIVKIKYHNLYNEYEVFSEVIQE